MKPLSPAMAAMKAWEVLVYAADSLSYAVRITVEAEDEWRAILAAGRTGQVPLNVREMKVYPLGSQRQSQG